MQKKEEIYRIETLGTSLSCEDGSSKEILFRTEDDEFVHVYIFDPSTDKTEYVGSMSMADFLSLSQRSLELWKQNTKEA